jgi:pimeloyl-ACP methyl ester carboxylesterase
MGEYVIVQGHPTWVSDTGGDRSAVLMLHGGLMNSETSWGDQSPTLPDLLSEHCRVVQFDRRGHGRTADTDQPFHYVSMADEAAGVIEALDLAPVVAIGYSDGGNLLLHLALRHPELLDAMVLISANFHHDALHKENDAILDAVTSPAGPLADGYAQRSPDGREHWPVVAAKGLTMGVREEPTFTVEDLAAINVPTLVIGGDDDQFPTTHTVALYDALADARLAIIPNSSHLVAFEQPEALAGLILQFLEHPNRMPTLLPIKRPTAEAT